MATPEQKRMNLFIPSSLFEEIKRIISPTNTSQSDFVRTALNEHVNKIKLQQLEEELKEGYIAKAKLNLKICEDFKHVDGENI